MKTHIATAVAASLAFTPLPSRGRLRSGRIVPVVGLVLVCAIACGREDEAAKQL